MERDSGHSRVPEPPDRITGTIIGTNAEIPARASSHE
jgi:hypothetical protein